MRKILTLSVVIALFLAVGAGILVSVLIFGGSGARKPVAGGASANTLGAPAQRASLTVTTATGGSLSTSPAQRAAAAVAPSVVSVQVDGQVTGSGLIVSSDGTIVTSADAIGGAGAAVEVRVSLVTGEALVARVAAQDEATGLAVLEVDRTGLPAVTFAARAKIQVGEYAVAIGSPLAYQNSVTMGIVSGLDRTLDRNVVGASGAGAGGTGGAANTTLSGLIQTDAPVSPGSSGGPLVDSAGRVIGITVAYLSTETGAENIGFAVPAGTVAQLLDQAVGAAAATSTDGGAR
jgi:S1-C subfamily serine protease